MMTRRLDHEWRETTENRERKAFFFAPFVAFASIVVQTPSIQISNQNIELSLADLSGTA